MSAWLSWGAREAEAGPRDAEVAACRGCALWHGKLPGRYISGPELAPCSLKKAVNNVDRKMSAGQSGCRPVYPNIAIFGFVRVSLQLRGTSQDPSAFDLERTE